ncbi:MAG: CDP-alcohol phosphatidyltransferase family protein [Methanomassiliicoccales archaeon]|nr:CDP-alcohol phosphatidyltransferase family protein [Methanomassiliicoccales archaeon]
MVLESLRNDAEVILDPFAKAFRRVNPNTLSWTAFLFAIAAGISIYFSYWVHPLLIATSILIILNGFFDALDGKVARLSGRASKSGDFVDHVLDRYADVLMIGLIAVSPWCNPYIGILAIIGVLLTSYMGTQAQAVGAGRLYSGLLGRADRIVILFFAPLVQWGLIFLGSETIGFDKLQFTIFELVMLWFAIVGNLTAVQRAYVIWKKIK